ncbi:MAG: response regulator [Pseudomonadota bacterium]
MKRILLVDDEPIVAKLYTRALTNAGHDVAYASDGAEGFEMAKTEPFDLIITDMQMPRRTGAQLAEALTKRELKHCPILLLSASDSGEGLVSCVEAGCDDFMRKGDSFHSIIGRVTFWLSAPLKALPDDARAIFIQRTPEVATEITALHQLGRSRWLLEERAALALEDQLHGLPERYFDDLQARRRLLGFVAGVLDRLGRSDPLSYLRRGDLMLACVSLILPDQVEQIRSDLADFEILAKDATYRHAKQTLLLNPIGP